MDRAEDLVMEELEETSSLSSSSAQGVDSLLFDMNFKGLGRFEILQGSRAFKILQGCRVF